MAEKVGMVFGTENQIITNSVERRSPSMEAGLREPHGQTGRGSADTVGIDHRVRGAWKGFPAAKSRRSSSRRCWPPPEIRLDEPTVPGS